MQTSLLSFDSNRFLREFIRKSESFLVWNTEKYLYFDNILLSCFNVLVIEPKRKSNQQKEQMLQESEFIMKPNKPVQSKHLF